MRNFIIERNLPGAENLTAEELKSISRTSCNVLSTIGPGIQWVHSYVAGDKIYCVYKASNADLIYDHARLGGFTANAVTEIASVIDPATAG